jgi:type II secretory pathway predicted ATPase ExeA
MRGLSEITHDELVKTLSPLDAYYHKDASILFGFIKKILMERGASPEEIEKAFAFTTGQPMTAADLFRRYGWRLRDIANRMNEQGFSISRTAISRSMADRDDYRHQHYEQLIAIIQGMLLERGCPLELIERILLQKNNSLIGGIEMLTKEVLEYWGLKRQPFINELGGDNGVYLTPNHQKVLDEIENCAECMGFIYVVGDIGSGKTTLGRIAIQRLKEKQKRMHIIYMEEPEEEKLRINDVYIWLLNELGIRNKPSSTALKLGKIKERLEKLYLDGFTTFIMIDEAQSLKWETISGFKKLYDTYYGLTRIIAICLLGAPELRKKIQDYRVESTALRLSPVELKPLGDYVPGYIKHKIVNAGGTMEIFEKSAILELADPSLKLGMKNINKIISRALTEAAEMKIKIVDGRFIHFK